MAGQALQYAYDRKGRQVGDDCLQEGVKFFPLPVETLGGWNQKAIKVVSRQAPQLARHSGNLESEVTSHMYERLSILFMEGMLLCFSADLLTIHHKSLMELWTPKNPNGS